MDPSSFLSLCSSAQSAQILPLMTDAFFFSDQNSSPALSPHGPEIVVPTLLITSPTSKRKKKILLPSKPTSSTSTSYKNHPRPATSPQKKTTSAASMLSPPPPPSTSSSASGRKTAAGSARNVVIMNSKLIPASLAITPKRTKKPSSSSSTLLIPKIPKPIMHTKMTEEDQLRRLTSALKKTETSDSIDGLLFYRLGATIGEGAFGEVRLATHVLTGERVAIKTLDKYKIKQFERFRTGEYDDAKPLCTEVESMKKLSHRNVLRLFQVISTSKRIHMVLEYCDSGTLAEYIANNGKTEGLPANQAKQIFKQIANGLHHVHSRSICHRDVKPENILLRTRNFVQRASGANNLCVKISDFGVSQDVEKGKKLSLQCGTPSFAAPEMIGDKRYNGNIVDAWSLGVVLYQLVTGKHPFEVQSRNVLYDRICKGQFSIPGHVSSDCCELIHGLMTVEAGKRMSVESACKHSWFADEDLVLSPERKHHHHNHDEEIVLKMMEMGFKREDIMRSLKNALFDSCWGCYHLLQEQKERQQERSMI